MDRPETSRSALSQQVIALVRASHPEPAAAVTACLTALAVSTGRSLPGLLAVFAAVLASQLSIGWCNDWLDADRDVHTGRTDKPVAAGEIPVRTVRAAAFAAAAVSVPLALLSGPTAALVLVLSTACGWAYDVRLKSSVLSPLPYALAFGAAPAFVVLGLPGAPAPPLWLVATGALLGTGAHFANVIPDLADDAATGVRGLPHRLGVTGCCVAAGVLLGGASAVLAFGPPGPVRPVGLATLAAAVAILGVGLARARQPGSRAPFRAVLVVALLDVLLLVASGGTIA